MPVHLLNYFHSLGHVQAQALSVKISEDIDCHETALVHSHSEEPMHHHVVNPVCASG